MESNIKGLVAAGHEMASELKAECGAVDMRSVAKLISDLATQLEVQLVRANAQAEDQQKAIESIKQADAAVKLAHEKFSALAAENELARKAVQAFCDVVGDNTEVIAEVIGRDSVLVILEDMKATGNMPATDAFLAEVRAQGVEMLAKNHQSIVNALKGDSLFSDGEYRHAAIVSAAVYFAAELRKGGNQ
ncbi:ead/Ea22-like family protein [Escherichia coli]|nr:ead/Ea22-like family protein [Escherichia coli]EFI9987058.1 ead/Ea22-like family protein [Escherichia coli]EKM4139195.1 ead/Ea22-like family protein [Escherichia coli]ELJ1749322.1 ead/Ea22-like family protein [Escherichia coli]